MSVACVRHEARRQRNNVRAGFSAEQRTVRVNILSRVCVVSVPADVLADIADPASKVPIEIEERYVEALCQKSTDRALAGSTGADQPNHRIAGYLSGYKYAVATGFSNDKQNNRVTVSVRKTGETLQLFLDKNRIAEYEKPVPAGLLFNAMSFAILGSSEGENDKFYVSNITIIKEQGAGVK